MTDLATVLDRSRVAYASIHGYVYQAHLSVERWLELPDDLVLRCEGDEDIDQLLRNGSGGLSEQVKALSGDVNIRDQVVQDTLRQFAISLHRLRTDASPDLRRFVFTSTASLRRQRTDAGLPVDVLAAWDEAKSQKKTRGQVVKALQKLLPFPKPGPKHEKRLGFWQQLQEALAWLKSDPEHWADFIRSVEWKLGEPDLVQVRGRIDQTLSRLHPNAPPHFRERLLDEVLMASIAREPRDRCRTREQLLVLIEETEAKVARWMAGRGHGLVQRLQELDDLRGVLYDKPLELPASPLPSQLLTAAYEVIPFDATGREQILKDLARWCEDEPKRHVRLIYGDGGLGKTRLLIEWCRQMAAQGWITGFLEPTATEDEMARLSRGALPRLVVIDYAETRLEAVRFLVSRLARTNEEPRLRLVLLARRAGDWWVNLGMDSATKHLLTSAHHDELPRLLPGIEERRKAFRTAVQAFTPHLSGALHPQAEGPSHLGGGRLEKGGGQEGGGLNKGNLDGDGPHLDPPPVPTRPLPEGGRHLPEPDLTEEAFGRPLYLHMAALAAAQGHPVRQAAEALAETLRRERQYWQDELQEVDGAHRLDLEEALPTAVTALTLLGGLDTEPKARNLTQRLLPGVGTARPRLLATLLHRLYSAPPNSGRHLGGLEPDLLGEELVWDVLRQDRQALHVALDLADPAESKQILTVLTRLAQRPEREAEAKACLKDAFESKLDDLAEPALDVAVAQGDPVGKLLAEVIEERASFELASRIMKRCDGDDLQLSVPLREVVLSSTQRVYDQLRENADETEVPRAELARLASNLGVRLSDLGRREEALKAAQEAADLYRLLAQQRPDEFSPYLAKSLNNLGTMLSDLGRREEALEATQEAADLYRLLAQQRPDAFRPYLATSLNNLGIDLSDLGRREEALEATQEAADLYRLLAQQRPDAFRPDLAMSLNNLGLRLSDLGRREEALEATREAADLYRLLAQQRPDPFSPYLAVSLGNLSTRLSDTGHIEEALAAAEEGVRLLAPFFLRYPRAFEVWMTNNVRFFGQRCEEAGHEPDLELLGPIVTTLASLQEDTASEP